MATIPQTTASSPPTPQVLLLGLRRSGKTSLLSVLHKRMAPEETLFLDNTTRATPTHLDIWKGVTIWDGINLTTLINERADGMVGAGTNLSWHQVNGVVWVIDCQDHSYQESLSMLHNVILRAYAHNPSIHFHVFLHKIDGLSDDYRDDAQMEVEKRIDDNLTDASSSFTFARGVNPPTPLSKDNRASVPIGQYDEEEEQVANLDWQKLEAQAREKRYRNAAAAAAAAASSSSSSSPLAGVDSDPRPKKLSANDAASQSSLSVRPFRTRRRSSRADQGTGQQAANLETDVDLTLHQTSIHDASLFVAFSRLIGPLILSPPSLHSALGRLMDVLVEKCEMERAFLMHLPTRTWLMTDGGPFEKGAFQVVCDYLNFMTGVGGLFENVSQPVVGAGRNREGYEAVGGTEQITATSTTTTTTTTTTSTPPRAQSSSTLRLTPDLLLCFWQLDTSLGLVSILRSPCPPPTSSSTGLLVGQGSASSANSPTNALASGQSYTAEGSKRIPSASAGGGNGTGLGTGTVAGGGVAAEGGGGGGGAGAGTGAGGAAAGIPVLGLLDWNVDVFRRAVIQGLGKLRRGDQKDQVLEAFID